MASENETVADIVAADRERDICHKQKPCTDLWHDWNPMEEGEVK